MTIKYDEDNPQVRNIRYIFFFSIFILTIPLFLRKSLDDLQIITVMFLAFLFALCLWILSELPFFYYNYKEQGISPHVTYWKAPELEWPLKFFGLLIGYYVQPFIFSLKGELLLPSLRRTRKVAQISILTETILFAIIGYFAYLVLGNENTPELFILRKEYKGKNQVSERIFQFLIFCFFIINTLGLSMYITPVREYLSQYVDLKPKLNFILASLIPFFLLCLFSALYPNIIDAISFFGFTVYNFNGYVVPYLMAIAIFKIKQPSLLKRVTIYAQLVLFIGLGVVCIGI